VTFYIGLDQALNNTGIAVTNGKKIVTTQIINTSKEDVLDRLVSIEGLLTQLVTSIKPKVVFMEGIYVPASRLKSCMALVKVEALVQLLLRRRSLDFLSLPSSPRLKSSWPNQLGIASSKDKCVEFLKPILPKGRISDHETDAIGILWGGLVSRKIYTPGDIMDLRIIKVHAKKFRADPGCLRDSFV
jgi:Holliday junction resolvasome RuvABC endonuclease subunit